MEQSLRIEERDEGQLDHVYLAEPIPVASDTSISLLTPPTGSGVFPFLSPSCSNRSRKNGAKSARGTAAMTRLHGLEGVSHLVSILLVLSEQVKEVEAENVGFLPRKHEPPSGLLARYSAHTPVPLREGRHPPRPVDTAQGVALRTLGYCGRPADAHYCGNARAGRKKRRDRPLSRLTQGPHPERF
jgi:hypothetical protein